MMMIVMLVRMAMLLVVQVRSAINLSWMIVIGIVTGMLTTMLMLQSDLFLYMTLSQLLLLLLLQQQLLLIHQIAIIRHFIHSLTTRLRMVKNLLLLDILGMVMMVMVLVAVVVVSIILVVLSRMLDILDRFLLLSKHLRIVIKNAHSLFRRGNLQCLRLRHIRMLFRLLNDLSR
jgi:hypothetical protein